jgi:hypothetical protein
MSGAVIAAALFLVGGTLLAFRGRALVERCPGAVGAIVVALSLLTGIWAFGSPSEFLAVSLVAVAVSVPIGVSSRTWSAYILLVASALFAGGLSLGMGYRLGATLTDGARSTHYMAALPYMTVLTLVMSTCLIVAALSWRKKKPQAALTVGSSVLGALFALQGASLFAGGFMSQGVIASWRWFVDPALMMGFRRPATFLYFVPISGEGAVPEAPWAGYLAFFIPLAAMGYFIQTRIAGPSSEPPGLHTVSGGV